MGTRATTHIGGFRGNIKYGDLKKSAHVILVTCPLNTYNNLPTITLRSSSIFQSQSQTQQSSESNSNDNFFVFKDLESLTSN